MSTPKSPKGLSDAGRALYAAVLSDVPADWQLDARDLAVLEQAARLADTAAALQKAVDRDGVTAVGAKGQPRLNSAVTALTTARRGVAALLAQIDMGGVVAATPAQQRARRAALSRPRKLQPLRRAHG